MSNKITLLSEKFEIEQTGEEIEDITIIVDSALGQEFLYLEKNNIWNAETITMPPSHQKGDFMGINKLDDLYDLIEAFFDYKCKMRGIDSGKMEVLL